VRRTSRRERRKSEAARRGPNLAGELFPIRPYPLDVDAHMGPMLRAVGNAMTRPLGIRFPKVEDVLDLEDGAAVRMKTFAPRPTWRVLYKPWLSIWQRRHYDLLHWEDDPAIADMRRRVDVLAGRDLTSLSWAEVVATLHEAMELGPAVGVLRDRYFSPSIWAIARLWLLLRLAGKHDRFGTLLSGVETKTLEINRALERFADRARADAALRQLFATTPARDLVAVLPARPEARELWSDFQEFQRTYGHRETAITLFSQPSWGEAPEIPLGVIKALVTGPSRADAAAGDAMAWQQARDDLLAHTFLGMGPLRRAFLFLLERARVFPQVREDTHFYFGLPIPQERRVVFELARRLIDAGVLDARDDVFFLTLAELEGAGQPWPPAAQTVERLRSTVARRKARWAELAHVPFADPNAAEVPEAPPDALLAGTPGSAGVVEGTVRVVRSAAEFDKLQSGEILVAPFTNPSWTPLFALAAAVVVDTGGAISHAAIVAREYGVPAVMGTRNATARLVDGQRVRVDGTRGLVFAAGE
jgi:pyruvate,water dikinase